MKTSFIVLIGPFSRFIRNYIQKFRLLVNGCSGGRGVISVAWQLWRHDSFPNPLPTVWSLTFFSAC